MNWMTAFIWWLQTRKSYQALWLTPPSCRHLLHATPDSERMKSSSQAMRHFLPKRTSSSSASGHPRPALTQQTAKPMPTTSEPRPPEGRQDRGRSSSARRYPFPKRQEPRPKISLDPVPQESSWTARQKEDGPKSRYLWTTPQAVFNVLLATPLKSGCRGMCVYGSSRAHYSAQVSDRCVSGQNKTHIFKREQKYFSANHKHPALMQPVYTTVTTPCHTDRGLADHPRCSALHFPPGPSATVSTQASQETTAQAVSNRPLWRNQPWVSELFQLLKAALWPIPLRRDLLSQANGVIWYPWPELWALHVWPLDGSLSPSKSMS